MTILMLYLMASLISMSLSSSKTKSYMIDEIEALLLAQESRLEKKVQMQILDTRGRGQRGRSSNGTFNRGRGQRSFGNRSGRRGNRNFQGFQSFQYNQSFSYMRRQQQLICQLCGKGGHSI